MRNSWLTVETNSSFNRSMRLRTLMSRIAAVTRIPSALSSGLSMISIGNSLPSLRRPVSSIPVPICCANASSADRRPSAISRSAKAFRNDVLHLLPYELIAAVSELLLGLKIQKNDFSALVHHHHRIGSCFQQPAVPALHLLQMLFRILALADIRDHAENQKAFTRVDRVQGHLDGKFAPILAPPEQIAARPHGARRGMGREAVAMQNVLPAQSLRHENVDRLTDQLAARVIEQPLDRAVEQYDLAGAIDHHHAGRAGFNRQSEQLLAFAQIGGPPVRPAPRIAFSDRHDASALGIGRASLVISSFRVDAIR